MAIRGGKGKHGGPRAGAGRKAILRNRHQLSISLEEDDFARLASMAEARGVSIGALIREAVASYLKRRRGR